MKNALIAGASLAAIAAIVPAAAPTAAWAQDTAASDNIGAYVNLGLAHADGPRIGKKLDAEVLQGRVGYRFHPNFGVEAEGGIGLSGSGTGIYDANFNEARAKLDYQVAGYGVGYLPLGSNTDLFARVGYGTSKIKVSNLPGVTDNYESVNYGFGAQHRFDGVNGVRVDYTRYDFNHDRGHSDVFAVAYTRRF